MIEYTNEEIEENRKEALENQTEGVVEQAIPGTMSYHEALHTTSIVMDSVERHIMDHPAIVADKDAYHLAHNAFSSLFNLYQYLGEKHL